MSSLNETLVKVTVVTSIISAVIFVVIENWFDNHVDSKQGTSPSKNGTTPPPRDGTIYSNANIIGSTMQPYNGLYEGVGSPAPRTNNGHIFAKKFRKGGNPNSTVNFEQSGSFQSWTKNPFANGTSNSYARAVNNAAQDPTNQASGLISGAPPQNRKKKKAA